MRITYWVNNKKSNTVTQSREEADEMQVSFSTGRGYESSLRFERDKHGLLPEEYKFRGLWEAGKSFGKAELRHKLKRLLGI